MAHDNELEVIDGDQLSCIGHDLQEVPSHLQHQYGSIIKHLDLSFNNIKLLEHLDGFKCLRELVLDNNELTSAGMMGLPLLSQLETLTVNKNSIEDVEKLLEIIVKQCPSLNYLSLLGNHACPNELVSTDKDEEDYQRYRYLVIYRLKSLKFLDSRAVKKEERDEAIRIGRFMKVVRPHCSNNCSDIDNEDGDGHSPLPDYSSSRLGRHSGSFGQVKYLYFGRNSEGNRFISDSNL